MTIRFEGDVNKAKAAAERLKKIPNVLDHLASNPVAVLAEFGVDIDDKTAKAIQEKVKNRPIPDSPASVVHIDL